jgi:tetratricopeptide (TPR) repeat protein
MMNNLLRTLTFTLFLALLAVPSWAQVGRIQGSAVGEDGQPLNGAVVQIERTDQKGSYKVKTNKKGQFLHAGLPWGTYDVALTVDNKPVETVSNVRVSGGDGSPVSFNLQALKQQQQAANAGAPPTEEVVKGMSDEERAAYEEALKQRQEALEKNAALNTAFNNGMTALKAQDFETAVTALKEAVTLSDTQDVIWGNLGEAQSKLALTKSGDERTAMMAEAAASYRKAMELNPTQAGYPNNLGLALIQAGQSDEGMAMLEKAAASDPANAGKYYFNVGAILTNSGDVDGAIDAFRKATEAQPDYAAAHYQLGMSLVGKATFTPEGAMVPVDGTLEAFQKYLELQPNGPDAETAKAMVASLTTAVDTSFTNPNKKK